METTRLIGESGSLLEVLEQVSQVAPLDRPVLVVGERGTGKELIAERLHFLSKRWDQTFLKMNCAALHEELLESELFGHESGAFTGANRQRQGRFEMANEGTLFLDELATTSTRIQEKLLRIIEYGEFERLGGSKTLKVDVRLVAATNEDLPSLGRQGKFREDLLDRLAFDVITLPPLRARKEDIVLLASHFAINMTQELDRPYFAGFSEHAVDQLLEHDWPGNVRELKNVIERSVYRSPDPDEPLHDIVVDPFASPYRLEEQPTKPNGGNGSDATVTDMPASEETVATPMIQVGDDFKAQVQQYEIDLLQQALSQNQYNQKKTAGALGLSYYQLRGYLKKYALVEGVKEE
ncbi:MAG: phage shock protein operon transcriptional activator [Pseudomonadota bacterium]